MALANTDAEYDAIRQSRGAAIHDATGWQQFIEQRDDNVFARFDADQLKAFGDGLIFKGGGLAHADYAPLGIGDDAALKAAVFAPFGIGPGILADHDHYSCEGGHTCGQNLNKICMSNCLHDDGPAPIDA